MNKKIFNIVLTITIVFLVISIILPLCLHSFTNKFDAAALFFVFSMVMLFRIKNSLKPIKDLKIGVSILKIYFSRIDNLMTYRALLIAIYIPLKFLGWFSFLQGVLELIIGLIISG